MSRLPRSFFVSLSLAAFLPLAAAAVSHEVRIHLDLDNDPTTGCEVATVDGPFAGVEQTLISTVETTSPPEAGMVTDVAIADCVDPVTDTFSPPASFDGGWPVGIDNGVGGRDVVETYVPMAQLVVPDPSLIRLAVEVEDEMGGERALLTTNDSPDGPPILLQIGALLEIPTVSEWGALLLILLLVTLAFRSLRRRDTPAFLLLATLVAGSGAAWAAAALDGLIDDWAGITPLGSNGIVLFGQVQGSDLCFRVDVDLLFNAPPEATDDAYGTNEDTVLNTPAPGVLANDTDPNSDPLTVTAHDATSTYGAIVTVNADGSFSYDPTGSAALQALPALDILDDHFTYTIEDPSGGSDTATVTVPVIGVNDAPTAMDDTYETDEDVPLNISAPGVLVNDSDVDTGDAITAVLDTDVSDGTLALNADGSFGYTPDPDFNGVDSFTYHVTDGTADSPTVTATITVTPVNDGPNAVDDDFATDEDTVLTIPDPGVLTNDTDPEGDPLAVTAFDATSTQGATVSVNADGSFTYDPTGAAVLQALDTGEMVDDTFTYTIDDGSGNPDTATVTVQVSGVNDAPAAVDDAYSTDEDIVLNVTAPGVLSNDSDVDVETLSSIIVTGPSNAVGFSLGADGSFSYTPAPNFNGSDSFTYRAFDGTTSSTPATVTITVNPVNDAPVAADDSVTAACNLEHVVETDPGQTAAGSAPVFRTVSDNVLADDSDPVEGSAISIVQADGTTSDATAPFDITTNQGGTVTLYADGSFVYTPEGGDRNLADTFTYTIQDAEGGQGVGTVTLNVADVCVWFVDNSVSPLDDVGTGTSSDPFTSLVDEIGPDADPDDAEDASQAGDVIYVFEGDSTSGDPYQGDFAAKANQLLLGEGVDLVVDLGSGPETLFTGNPANRPLVDDTDGDAIVVTDVAGVQVAGFQLDAADHALEVTSAAAAAGVDFHDNLIVGAGAEGVLFHQSGAFDSDVRLADNSITSTADGIDTTVLSGTLELALDGNAILGAGTVGIELIANGGSLYVTSFCGNTVAGGLSVIGVQVLGATFDADPSDADFLGDQVGCVTTTAIGTSGSPLAGPALLLDTVSGDLAFGELSLHGTGVVATLGVTGTGSLNAGAGTGFRMTTTSGSVSANGGPAILVEDLTSGLVFDPVSATSSATFGISLATVDGSFTAGSGSSITGSSGNAFDVDQSTADVTYAGSITNASGRSVEVTNHGGGSTVLFSGAIADSGTGIFLDNNDQTAGSTVSFSGGLDLDTGANTAFNATNGGTVNVLSGAVSTTADTTTGTVVNIINTTIGASGVTFDSTSSTGGADGINLTNVGSGAFATLGGSLANQTNRGVDVSGGSGDVRIDASIDTTTTGRSVEVTTHTGGTVDFNGFIDDDGLGIRLANNVGSVLRFDGGMDVDTAAGSGTEEGFEATGGGTLHVTGTNDVNTSLATGIAVNIAGGTTIGSDDVTFRNVSASGAASGIVLNGTGTTGSFTVTGDGSMTAGVLDRNGSGGTINSTGSGVILTNANDVTLRQMHLSNNGDHAIEGSGGSGHVLSAVTIQNPMNHGWEATNLQGVNRIDHGSLVTEFNGVNQDGVRLINTSTGFTSFTVDNVTFSNSATGNDGFFHRALGTTAGSIFVTDSTFTGLDADGVQVVNDGSGTIETTIQGNSFTTADATGGDGNNGLALNLGGTGVHQFLVGGPNAGDGNTFTTVNRLGDNSGVINVTAAGAGTGATSRVLGTIQGNSISDSDGRRGISALFEASGGTGHGGHILVIDDNDVNDVAREGIYVGMSSVAGRSNTGNDITIRNNNVGDITVVSTAGPREGIEIEAFHAGAGGGSIEADVLVENNVSVINNTDETFRVTNDAFNGGATNLEVTVLGNTFTNNDASGEAFELRNWDVGSTSCLDINAANVAANRNNANLGYSLARSGGTFNIEGMGAGPNTDAQVNSFVDVRNDGGASAATGDNFTGGVSCTLP